MRLSRRRFRDERSGRADDARKARELQRAYRNEAHRRVYLPLR
ncbi:MAG TPA: hypothetical protein VFU14_14265 [Acidimicrobiales bacterium]|nr:hypothetical protein [Acidimicrobiales bacterium]